MSEQKRGRTGTRRTTLAVLEILKTSTDLSCPISIADLVKRLHVEYEIDTHRDSVKDILEDLMAYYPGPEKICCRRRETGRAYQTGYYWQSQLPEELQQTIQRLERAIQVNRANRPEKAWISFRLGGCGSDHRRRPGGGRIGAVLPVRILWAYGHPYLVGFFRERLDAAHFRVDLICELAVERQRMAEGEEQLAFRIRQVAEEDYLAAHPYMFYEGPGERPVNIRLWVKKLPGKPDSSLTFLQDVFGDSWRPISGTETHEALEIWVRCLPRAMLQFVRQYMDRVRVLEPEETAREVEDALRQDFEAYFQRKF